MFKRMRQVLVALSAALPVLVGATLPATVTLKELLTVADQVLLVQLVDGRLLREGDKDCGARYVGEVARSFKGLPKGSRVEFGPHQQLQIGVYYLLFLSQSSKPVEWYVSTNDRYLAAKADYLKSCKRVMAPFAIMHFSAGAMKVDNVDPNIDKWVVNWRSIVTLPKSIIAQETKAGALVTIGEITRAIQEGQRR